MTTKPKLARFQIHLSTMIILSFLTGTFIYADILYSRDEMSRISKRESDGLRTFKYVRTNARNETIRIALIEISGLIFFVLALESVIRRREARKP